MPQYKVMIARFPFKGAEHPDATDWVIETVLKAKADQRISHVQKWRKDDTPIPMLRNHCVQKALEAGADYLLMVDNDMSPDLAYAGSRPFWDSTWEFMLQHNGPCVVAAPYCGPPPHENVYIFRWSNRQSSSHQETDISLEQFTREDAAQRSGIEEVGALPTGLILMDMRVFKSLPPPHFYYEYTDQYHQQKASTEDVTFTRDLSMHGIPVYVNWDSWAGHWKQVCVGKPQLIYADHVRGKFADAVLRGAKSNETLRMVGEGENKDVLARTIQRFPVLPGMYATSAPRIYKEANGEQG